MKALVPVGFLLLLAVGGLGFFTATATRLKPGEPTAAPPTIVGREVFAAPDGKPRATGTLEDPVDLATMLSKDGPAGPGDQVWLTGGIYHGTFISELRGLERAPIVVRAYRGERVTIDSAPSADPALTVRGAWTTYWGIEVTNSDPLRISKETGPFVHDLKRGGGVDVHGPNTKFVNMIVHDAAAGFGIWIDAENAEAYGNLIYYNGWQADDKAHGHGVYTQNKIGRRVVADNIIFAQFAHGIHAYGTSQAYLDGITLEGNISFNNGVLDPRYFDRNILLGGGRLAVNPIVRENYTFYTPGLRRAGENNFGYSAGCSDLVVERNYFTGALPVVLGGGCGGVMTGNLFQGPVDRVLQEKYPDNTYLTDRPTGVRVFVRPNRYEPGRAHIAIYNWDRRREVAVDLSSANLPRGSRFEIRDAQNYFGSPVVTGTYQGVPVTVPMTGLTPAAPVGDLPTPPHTAPEFGAFVLIAAPR